MIILTLKFLASVTVLKLHTITGDLQQNDF